MFLFGSFNKMKRNVRPIYMWIFKQKKCTKCKNMDMDIWTIQFYPFSSVTFSYKYISIIFVRLKYAPYVHSNIEIVQQKYVSSKRAIDMSSALSLFIYTAIFAEVSCSAANLVLWFNWDFCFFFKQTLQR